MANKRKDDSVKPFWDKVENLYKDAIKALWD